VKSMKKLNFRTAPTAGRKPRRGKLPELIQTGPKGFFIRRCPWTGYFYAKGGRDSKSNGKWGRAIRGMKWNCYLREGLKPLKDFRSDIMFFINLSIAWKLIKRWKSRGANAPGMPLLEGIRSAPSVHAHHSESRGGKGRCHESRGQRQERAVSANQEPEGRPRIEERARACDEEDAKPGPVTRFPGKRILPSISGPSLHEKPSVGHTKRTPESPRTETPGRVPPKEKAPERIKKGSAIQKGKVRKTIKPVSRKADVPRASPARTVRPKRVCSRERPAKASLKCGRTHRRARERKTIAVQIKPAGSAHTRPSLQPMVSEHVPTRIMLPEEVYRRQHRPTVSSARKKVRQLKVTRADDPNLPR